MRPYRSILFLPGHKPDWAAKALKTFAITPEVVRLTLRADIPIPSVMTILPRRS